MEYIICGLIVLSTIILFKIIFKINIKKIKALSENKELSKITEKFPQDIKIAEEMLDMLNNNSVKVEQATGTNSSLYIAVTNKISIADMKKNYGRIQTIAHECLHSCQDRTLLIFNFIFSNVNILYFLLIIILTMLKVINKGGIWFFLLMLFSIIQFSVREYLETDAMSKSTCLAEKYIDKKQICTEEEKENLLSEYKNINKLGIPFVIDNLLTIMLTKFLIYTIVCVII